MGIATKTRDKVLKKCARLRGMDAIAINKAIEEEVAKYLGEMEEK